MALTQVYTAVSNDVITSARWNNEFGNIYNNGTDIAFPLTKAASLFGFTLTLDSAGVSTLISTASQALNFTPGAKAGTPGTTGATLNVVAHTFTDTNTAISGTAASFAAVAIQRPTLAAQNATVTTTDAASLYIANAPLAGTNETITNPWSIWVDAGNVRFDGALTVAGILTATGGVIGTATQLKYIAGLTYAPDAGDVTNDIAIAAGECTSTHATPASRVSLVTGALIKRIDASWVTGTNQGGLSSSLSATDRNYYIHAIRVAGVDDIGFDISPVAANLITDHGATHYRLIGFFTRLSSANTPFTTYEIEGGGLEYLWTTVLGDINLAATLTTTRRTDTIRVPLDFSVLAIINTWIDDATTTSYYIYCPDQADQNPSVTVAPGLTLRTPVAGQVAGGLFWVRTSATGQIAAEATTATVDTYEAGTLGFQWSRR